MRILALVQAVALFNICIASGFVAPVEAAQPPPDPPETLRILCYHDIRDHLKATLARDPEPAAMDTDDFVDQLAWLREHGYHPVSLDDVLASRAQLKPLPRNAVLLTFDDGYRSVYTRVFPLLKLFNYPAVIGLVGSWLDTPADTQIEYAGVKRPRSSFVTWSEVREMQASGLVEIASHSYDLHRGVVANPQGNSEPAAVTRIYDPTHGSYEDDHAYVERLRTDLARSSEQIERETGRRPRAMIWPYGAYNQTALQVAREAGMPVTFNLEPGPNPPSHPLNQLRRMLTEFHDRTAELHENLQAPAEFGGEPAPRLRAVQVDLDYVYDPDPAQQEANLSLLVERIKRYDINTVFLQAFADPNGRGVAEAVYFPNRHLPMRADLFNRAAWQLRTRAMVKVYAWMPVLAFKLPGSSGARLTTVRADPDTPVIEIESRPRRLSPFDPDARRVILDIYEDLGKHAAFAGVLFHDDAFLGDDEDVSDSAMGVYARDWGLPPSLAAMRTDPQLMSRWTEKKAEALDALTRELAAKLREYQPALLTARNIFALPVLDPRNEPRFSQSYSRFLQDYDFTVLMAMPFMEQVEHPLSWLEQLERKVAQTPNGLARTVFELQTRDWSRGAPVPDDVLVDQIRRLQRGGAVHLGYYPDDFLRNAPSIEHLRPVLSLETNPAPDLKLTQPTPAPCPMPHVATAAPAQKQPHIQHRRCAR